MKEKKANFLHLCKAKDLAAYILLISGKSLVKYRRPLFNSLINGSLSIIELLYETHELDIKRPDKA